MTGGSFHEGLDVSSAMASLNKVCNDLITDNKGDFISWGRLRIEIRTKSGWKLKKLNMIGYLLKLCTRHAKLFSDVMFKHRQV